MDVAAFRIAFPTFASVEKFPDAGVSFWLLVAGKLLRPERWFDLIGEGQALFAAHNLSLEEQARAQAAKGAAPGFGSGMISAKSVDKLSITYDTSVGVDATAGHWGLTTYGGRFLWLMNLAGMGGTQIGAGAAGGAPGEVWRYGGAYGPGWPHGY